MFGNCLKLSESHARSLSSSGNEFQTVEPCSNLRSPTAVCVESSVRYDELVTVGGTSTKRSDFRGCNEMIGKVPTCLLMQTAMCHDAQLPIQDSLWHIEPAEFMCQSVNRM